MYKLKHIIVLILISLLISGCDNNEKSDDKISLAKLQSVDEGFQYSIGLTGTDLNEKNYTGSIEVSNGPQITHGGLTVFVNTVTLNITNDDTPSIFSIYDNSTLQLITFSTIDMDGNLIQLLENTGNSCINTSPDKLPPFVEIGDTGVLSPLECLSNITRYRNWIVENAGQNNIKIIITNTDKDIYDSIVSEKDMIYILDTTGNIIGFETELTIYAHPQSQPYTSRLKLYTKI